VRPKTIVYFERIMFGTPLLGVLQCYLLCMPAIVLGAPDRNSVAVFLIFLIFIFVLIATLGNLYPLWRPTQSRSCHMSVRSYPQVVASERSQ
jgi:hypothetical protein